MRKLVKRKNVQADVEDVVPQATAAKVAKLATVAEDDASSDDGDKEVEVVLLKASAPSNDHNTPEQPKVAKPWTVAAVVTDDDESSDASDTEVKITGSSTAKSASSVRIADANSEYSTNSEEGADLSSFSERDYSTSSADSAEPEREAAPMKAEDTGDSDATVMFEQLCEDDDCPGCPVELGKQCRNAVRMVIKFE